MLKGFNSEISDSQIIFRQILNATANPGTITETGIELNPPENIHKSSGAILLALLDFESSLWSDTQNNSNDIEWIKFHTGTQVTSSKEKALFALYTDSENLGSPDLFNQGTIDAPHLSATVIIQTCGIDNGKKIRLSGPGIRTESFLNLKGVSNNFLHQRAEMFKCFPLGIDMIFVYGSIFTAIPRTTRVEVL